ncbi:hypothetical protein [Paracoccus jeotgali]|uniref:hypothetical protein n=1 Tax=Paracoccus jeotgali TaxID=2065379 RepID=UPI001315A5AF|nr:hypothetical protein [Paracoccus jeotgali]
MGGDLPPAEPLTMKWSTLNNPIRRRRLGFPGVSARCKGSENHADQKGQKRPEAGEDLAKQAWLALELFEGSAPAALAKPETEDYPKSDPQTLVMSEGPAGSTSSG